MRRRTTSAPASASTLALVAGLLVLLVWLVLPGRSALARVVVGNTVFIAVSALAAAWCLVAARRAGASRPTWVLLGAGAAAWSSGGLVYAYDQLVRHQATPFPSWAYLGAVSMPLCSLVGLLRLPALARRGVHRVRLLLDGLVVASSLLVLLWLTPAAEAVLCATGPVAQSLAFAMPALDVLAVSVAVVVLDRVRGRSGVPVVLAALAVAGVGTSEAVYVAAAAAGEYTIGGVPDLSWCAAFALLAVAARRHLREPDADAAPPPQAGAVEGLRLLPLLPAAAAVVALVVSGRTSTGLDAVLTACLLVLGASLVVRQYLLHGENAALHRSLEATVEARTRQLREAHERERVRASTDELTGLANRPALLSAIAAALGRADAAPVAVVLLDLDGFKAVNDGLGHAHGDHVLVAAAQRLRGVVRDGGLARLGGDEFACVLPGLEGADDAVRVAERLVAVLSEPLAVDGRDVVLGASAGVAVATCAGRTPHDLLREADTAMYAAKRAGGNGVRVFDQPMQAAVLAGVAVESDLHVAVREQQVELHYQPVQDLATGRVVGVEALARWDRPGLGPVPPDVFIPAAERTGLIVPLERYLLDLACAQTAAWRRDQPDLKCGVNLSPRHLREPDVVEAVLRIVDRHGLHRSAIVVEVTEGLFFSDEGAVGQVLRRLVEAGITLALDDFGTGWSSLSRLTRHPFKVLKVDRSFLTGLVGSGPPPAELLAALAVGRELGLDLVAEGVESQEQLDVLARLGCQFAQGYYLARPGPASAVTDRVLNREPVPVPSRLGSGALLG